MEIALPRDVAAHGRLCWNGGVVGVMVGWGLGDPQRTRNRERFGVEGVEGKKTRREMSEIGK